MLRRAHREGDAGLGLHGGLVERVVHHLDRVFDRGDVDLALGDAVERRVEGRALTGAGGAGDQDDAVRTGDEGLEHLFFLRVEAETHEVLEKGLRVEDAQDDLLAKGYRQSRDTQLDLLSLARGLDSTVLRATTLGDVEPRHRLDAADDRAVHDLGDGLDVVQDTVDAEPDVAAFTLWLDVDVAGAGVVGMLQHELDGVDDVLVARLDLLVVLHVNELFEIAEVDARIQVALCLLDRLAQAVELGDGAQDVGFGRHHQL